MPMCLPEPRGSCSIRWQAREVSFWKRSDLVELLSSLAVPLVELDYTRAIVEESSCVIRLKLSS